MSVVLQQGGADNMCGLYAVLNFLNRQSSWKEEPADGMWYLLEACRQFGWFTPQYLTQGFEEYQLKAILDLQFSNYRMPFSTHYVTDVANQLNIRNFYDLAVRVAARNGSIIASWERRDHWVLVTSHNGELIRLDSDSRETPTIPIQRNQRALKLDSGVVVLPRELCVEKADI